MLIYAHHGDPEFYFIIYDCHFMRYGRYWEPACKTFISIIAIG